MCIKVFLNFLHFDSLIVPPGIYPKEINPLNHSAHIYRTPIIMLGFAGYALVRKKMTRYISEWNLV